MRPALGLLALACAGGLIASCDSATEARADFRQRLLEDWGQHVALPAYRRFETGAADLDAQVGALCTAPSADTLDAAKTAWGAARGPWKEAEVFAFGPYREAPLRIQPKVDFWPVRPGSIDAVLTGDGAVDAVTVAGLGAATKGLPAIEYLLWSAEPAAFVDRRCDYLRGLTTDLAVRAREIRAAWDPTEGDYAGQLARSGRGGAFDTLQKGFAEVVNRMGYTLENMRFDKLGKPVGLEGGSAQADKVESGPSGRSIQDMHDTLTGIAALYRGGDAGIGLRDYLAFRSKTYDSEFDGHLDSARAALDAIPGPLTSAITADPDSVRGAIDALGELQLLIQVDMANALAVNIAFNDADGD